MIRIGDNMRVESVELAYATGKQYTVSGIVVDILPKNEIPQAEKVHLYYGKNAPKGVFKKGIRFDRAVIRKDSGDYAVIPVHDGFNFYRIEEERIDP